MTYEQTETLARKYGFTLERDGSKYKVKVGTRTEVSANTLYEARVLMHHHDTTDERFKVALKEVLEDEESALKLAGLLASQANRVPTGFTSNMIQRLVNTALNLSTKGANNPTTRL
jgi:hypothetical protein